VQSHALGQREAGIFAKGLGAACLLGGPRRAAPDGARSGFGRWRLEVEGKGRKGERKGGDFAKRSAGLKGLALHFVGPSWPKRRDEIHYGGPWGGVPEGQVAKFLRPRLLQGTQPISQATRAQRSIQKRTVFAKKTFRGNQRPWVAGPNYEFPPIP